MEFMASNCSRTGIETSDVNPSAICVLKPVLEFTISGYLEIDKIDPGIVRPRGWAFLHSSIFFKNSNVKFEIWCSGNLLFRFFHSVF